MDSDLVSSLRESLDKVDEETINQEFNMLRSQSSMWRKSQCSEAGALKENHKKNRYKDILPFDESRVVLSLETSESDGDYINASFIKGPLSLCIAAQAPLSSTLTDFWRMIWEYHIKVIVMACKEFEMGKKKCESYWSSLNQTTSFGPFSVHCQGVSSPTEHIIIRELQVSYKQEVRVVTQLQFLSWPDHDVPHEASGVLDLLHRIWTLQEHKGPKLVHCSAGCGRTGVLCALDQIYSLLIHKKLSSDFSILRIVQELRRQRPSSVQTKGQYQFIFRATSCLFRWYLQKNSFEEQADATQIYSNSLPQGTQKKLFLKKPRITPSVSAPATSRCDQKKMEAMYAVVNKNKSNQSESSLSPVATPRSTNLTKTRATEVSHHYDNDPSVPPIPVYSVVRPRLKPHLSEAMPNNLYDLATPTCPDTTPHYYLLSEAVKEADDDDDYEDVSPPDSDSSGFPSANGIGFKRRIPKPRGPRDPPAEWTRLDR